MNPKGWGTWKEDLKDWEVDGYQNLLELIWVVVWKIFYFHPYLGKMIHLTNIFQMGWNHQVGTYKWLAHR